MNQQVDIDAVATQPSQQPATLTARLFRLALPVIIVIVGLALASYLMLATPKVERVTKPREARLVEVTTVSPALQSLRITAWGEVKPAQEVVVRAQVSGVVQMLSPGLEPGSFVTEGQTLVRLEQADYQAALIQQQAALQQAKAELEIEQGNQAVARSEFALLGGDVSPADRKRMLRVPQLQVASAQVQSAEAALAAAQLNLDRTVIRAPFAGVIRERHVNVGSHLAVNGDVVTLTGTAMAWVELSVPLTELQWIQFPDADGNPGSTVTLYYDQVWAQGQTRSGRVVRLLSDLESTGRMARILVEVDDPLARDSKVPPLLMGSFVRADISGKPMDHALLIPASLLRENDTVWRFVDGELKIQPVTVLYRTQSEVYVGSGIQPGDLLVVSALSTVTDGMPVRLAETTGGSSDE